MRANTIGSRGWASRRLATMKDEWRTFTEKIERLMSAADATEKERSCSSMKPANRG